MIGLPGTLEARGPHPQGPATGIRGVSGPWRSLLRGGCACRSHHFVFVERCCERSQPNPCECLSGFSPGSAPEVGIAVWQSAGVINGSGSCQVAFQDCCALLSLCWQYTNIPTDSHSHQCLLESAFPSSATWVSVTFSACP